MDSIFRRLVLTLAAVFLLTMTCAAQLVPASPTIADPNDTRFADVTEDWTSPSLDKSHLKPVRPWSSNVINKKSLTLEIVRVQWRWGDPIDLYIMKPKAVKTPAVVLYLYGYKSDTDRFLEDSFEERVTRDGIAAVGFVSALSGNRYHDRPMKQWFVSNLQECLAVSAHDVQMILNYLASRGDLDMDRVGVFASDSGASIAILASAVDSRIKVLDVVDPWGDWPDWLATSPIVPEEERKDYLTPEFLKNVADFDPVVWLPRVQAKKIRFQDATFAKSTPTAAKEKLRAAVSAGTEVVIYKTPEETKAISSDNNVLDWMEAQLRSLSQTDLRNHVATSEGSSPSASN